MGGIKITDVKIVGMCSKHRREGDEIPKDIHGRVYENNELACVGCHVGSPIKIEFEIIFCSEGIVKDCIKSCEGKHIQQVVYSTYHNALTQICFGCKKVRTSLKEKELSSKHSKKSVEGKR